MMMGETLRTS